jgi:hypothetical protein
MKDGRNSLWVWTAIIVAVGMGAVWQFYPLQDASDRLEAFPLKSVRATSEDAHSQ